ncbi:MAG TPA: tetratricopeptide repeat protein [Candidatus Acidoferrales bacterium]|nr:tetratricopeptide repeat protein [Candidatus Acidoferrales bacterium]
MTGIKAILALLVFSFAAGCASYRIGGEVQPGRYALNRGDAKAALFHFQRAAEMDPDYVTDFTLLPQGIWTYIGKAYYTLGNLAEARKALERANSLHKDDYLADLYLGLVLARQGDWERGRKDIQAGLSGIHNWLEYVDAYHPDGRYWDPGRIIRTQIERDLQLIAGGDVDRKEIISRGEYIGYKIEREIDQAPIRWRRALRDSDGRDRGRGGRSK